MTAWANLLAASQLSSGTAWQLLTNPKTGTGGTVVLNDGYTFTLDTPEYEVELMAEPVEVEVDLTQIEVELQDNVLVVELTSTVIEVEVSP